MVGWLYKHKNLTQEAVNSAKVVAGVTVYKDNLYIVRYITMHVKRRIFYFNLRFFIRSLVEPDHRNELPLRFYLNLTRTLIFDRRFLV